MRRTAIIFRVLAVAIICTVLGACSWSPRTVQTPEPVVVEPPQPNPGAPRLAPLETREFTQVADETEVLGALQVLFARDENTFAALARTYDLGYQEMRHANPGVDAWLPGAGTPIYLPTMRVIPDVPRGGIVLNLPSMRLLYFSNEKASGASEVRSRVTSYPMGIGREGWATPTGEAHITEKKRNPNWYPPASVRAEHAALGDPLPAVVPPGPDNPLGHFKMRLSMPGYLIHGTNKPSGVGMRVSHGCIRLYPEDIETLFELVPSRTPVAIVNQPVLAGWRDGELYLEVHPPLSEDTRDMSLQTAIVIEAALLRAARADAMLDADLIATIVAEKRGIPFPILQRELDPERYLSAARVIENVTVTPVEENTASR
jgi:L,D-transpeptidase ErfK/SrfK